jgi:hypothetical protein
MAAKHPHLAHLAGVSVEVKDWSDLCSLLQRQPHLVFRWFPGTRPSGLVSLDEGTPVGTFRSYLDCGRLPYYSREEHIQRHPASEGIAILSEVDLLDALETGSQSGLIVYGQGGVGKTRLAMELGRLALARNWTVLRVEGRLRPGALDRLAERLSPKTPVLLLVDYIEMQGDFAELVEDIESLNGTCDFRIRYVASCRSAYYPAVRTTGRHRPVDLSPPPGDPTLNWFESYRKAAVEHILNHCGVSVTRQHLAACRQTPILAVFMAYLHETGRGEDLRELLGEEDFGRWVAKRVQLSFQRNVHRELALLITLFPMSDAAARQVLGDPQRPLFDRLAADGWIEKAPSPEEGLPDDWVTAHDVLADQVVLSYVQGIAATAAHFVEEVLQFAVEIGCLGSALFAFQRLADRPPFNALGWFNLIKENIARHTERWRTERDAVIRTSLMTAAEHIALLDEQAQFWEGAETEVQFQNTLGWLARCLVENGELSLDPLQRETLSTWIAKAASHVGESNFILTWGLRFAPDTVREYSLKWIRDRPAVFQTHYLMVAWMESGQAPDEIRHPVEQWCSRFAGEFHLSFVACAWLNAGGDRALVETPIRAWLGQHATDAEADFVYKAWLDAGGDFAAICEGAIAWLHAHRHDPQAVYLTKYIAKQRTLPIEAVRDVLFWCRSFPANDDVGNAKGSERFFGRPGGIAVVFVGMCAKQSRLFLSRWLPDAISSPRDGVGRNIVDATSHPPEPAIRSTHFRPSMPTRTTACHTTAWSPSPLREKVECPLLLDFYSKHSTSPFERVSSTRLSRPRAKPQGTGGAGSGWVQSGLPLLRSRASTSRSVATTAAFVPTASA